MKFDGMVRAPGLKGHDDTRKLVVFEVGDVVLGIDILSAKVVMHPGPVVPVPSAAPFVAGASEFRNALIPVLDLHRLLGVSKKSCSREKWIVVTVDARDAALVVDAVRGVVTFGASDLRERPPLMGESSGAPIKAAYGGKLGVVFELDLAAIVAADPPSGLPPAR